MLQNAYEYRQPSPQKRAEAAVAGAKVTVDMTSRFLGLVVVPGEHIVSMQLEEFASQLRR